MTRISQIKAFLEDYGNAQQRASALDAQIEADASKISADYAGIVALSVRQAFGALEIVVPQNPDGSYDTSNVRAFVKGTLPPVTFGSFVSDRILDLQIWLRRYVSRLSCHAPQKRLTRLVAYVRK